MEKEGERGRDTDTEAKREERGEKMKERSREITEGDKSGIMCGREVKAERGRERYSKRREKEEMREWEGGREREGRRGRE